jgi:hypothetical protein
LDCKGIGLSTGGILVTAGGRACEDVDGSAGRAVSSFWSKGCEDVDWGSRRIEGSGPKLKALNLHDFLSVGGEVEPGEYISSPWCLKNE